MEAWWYPALFATGLAAGFVDAIAGGGGLITVPVLLATGMSPQDALGTNKFQSSCGTALATAGYARHGLLRWAELRTGVIATFVGAAAGAWVVKGLQAHFLRPAIPALLLVIAALHVAEAGPRPRSPGGPRLPAPVFAVLFGLTIGLLRRLLRAGHRFVLDDGVRAGARAGAAGGDGLHQGDEPHEQPRLAGRVPGVGPREVRRRPDDGGGAVDRGMARRPHGNQRRPARDPAGVPDRGAGARGENCCGTTSAGAELATFHPGIPAYGSRCSSP